MRSKFWTLLLTGVAVTALAGFSPTTQDAEAGLFSRLRAHFNGDCGCTCSGEVVASCCPAPCPAPAPSCCPAPCPPTCCPAPCDACGSCGDCGCESDCDTDHDDDCDD